ncbi:MAG: glycoside hydrolase family 43 protein [Puniceicoccaceae bacterium]
MRYLVYLLSFLLASSQFLAAEEETVLPETCYLFAHFYLNGDSGLHLAWSPDGLKWTMLNGGESFLVPAVGESGLMRDPSLTVGPDGRFHMVWTTSWTGQTIGYASSDDLLNWSEQKAIPVMGHEPEVWNCWAPEVIWVPEDEHFLIIWSSTITGRFPETGLTNRRPPRNHRIYRTTTKNFVTFTPTELHYDGGFNVIDAVLTPFGDEWMMFVKHEAVSPHTQKNIRSIRCRTPYGPFSASSAPISGEHWSEGPSVLKVGDAWLLYYDQHMIDVYGCRRTVDFQNWDNLDAEVEFPHRAKHGSFVAVDRAFLLQLMEATGDTTKQ